MNKNNIITTIFVILLIGDLSFSFLQYYQTPLFGDIENGVLPDNYVQQIIDDPLGFKTIKTGEKHPNPNRFFSHYFFLRYFQKVPILLQKFVNPISSVYLSCAIIKISVQILIIFLLSAFISGSRKIFERKFLLSAILIAPLFQSYGFWSRMGIIDKSIAYTFFYAVPLAFLMIFLIPFFKTKFNKINYFFLMPLVIVLPLSGPLIPGVILIVSFLIFAKYWIQNNISGEKNFKSFIKNIPLHFYLLLIPVSLWSLYSMLLGIYDSNYQSETIPLLDRFFKLPNGIYSQLFHSLGFPLMLFVIGLNVVIIKKSKNPEGQKLTHILNWIGIFALIYILLLPFGGYRPYRPRIIRYDTIMPVTISLIYFFAASTYFLFHFLKGNKRLKYSIAIVICLLVYTISDFKGIGKNKCERAAFEKMSISTENIVPIPSNCFVMSWETISDYRQSEKKAELIYRWRITDKKKLFYNESGY